MDKEGIDVALLYPSRGLFVLGYDHSAIKGAEGLDPNFRRLSRAPITTGFTILPRRTASGSYQWPWWRRTTLNRRWPKPGAVLGISASREFFAARSRQPALLARPVLLPTLGGMRAPGYSNRFSWRRSRCADGFWRRFRPLISDDVAHLLSQCWTDGGGGQPDGGRSLEISPSCGSAFWKPTVPGRPGCWLALTIITSTTSEGTK